MLWLAAYLTGFPPVGLHALSWTHGLAPMWSGLYIISTSYSLIRLLAAQCRVNALSGLYIISTLHLMESTLNGQEHTVSMPSRAYTSFLRCYVGKGESYTIVSMPSRAYTSFLRYPFKNLGFMRFPEPVFAGICQNILTTAVFRAC